VPSPSTALRAGSGLSYVSPSGLDCCCAGEQQVPPFRFANGRNDKNVGRASGAAGSRALSNQRAVIAGLKALRGPKSRA